MLACKWQLQLHNCAFWLLGHEVQTMFFFLCRYAVMVPDPRLDVSYQKDADQVLSSLLDFNPTEWGLPPFKE
mgnify:CR=1 FL=1